MAMPMSAFHNTVVADIIIINVHVHVLFINSTIVFLYRIY